MFKEFNWGHGIALFYIVFVGIVVTALVASFGVDHSLVEDDYYAEDLAYQQRYDKMVNVLDDDKVKVRVDDSQVMIAFSNAEQLSGSVHFYRASDKSEDFTKHIESQNIVIPVADMKKGKWSIKIDWMQDGKSYYTEEVIYI